MSTFLTEIIELKRKRLATAKSKTPLEKLKAQAYEARKTAGPHRLRSALASARSFNIIAEVKRASPSKGVINDKIDVAEIARAYERGGAAAVSVLTEEDRFQGSLEDLIVVRKSVDLPILRKDFIFDEFQVFEAAAAGADVILLIAAMLDDDDLKKLHDVAEQELGLDALVEVHTPEELERVKKTGGRIIGVNNRDLHSFSVSLDVSRRLIRRAPEGALMIAESGLKTPEDLAELKELGYSGFLIGETLMRSGDPERELKEFAADKRHL